MSVWQLTPTASFTCWTAGSANDLPAYHGTGLPAVLTTLAFRHLLVRKLRSLFLLLGFSLGVAVMIVLLSVGQAMLEQSRDISLVGGGQITLLPQGIDVEAMRTGGLSGMFFGIDRARFLVRQTVGGPRNENLVRAVSPAIEGKLLYLRHGERTLPVRAGGDVPSRARAVGSGLDVRSGKWDDSPADSSYVAPTPQELYDELDRFHLPPRPDSAWGEWHYFNLVTSPQEWWYITYLIGGVMSPGGLALRTAHGPALGAADEWGGQLLVTHRRPDGRYDRFVSTAPSSDVTFDTTRADLTIGENFVRQRNGKYQLRGQAKGSVGTVLIDIDLTPAPGRYFPPVELSAEQLVSGYVVPGLLAAASGRICVASRCRSMLEVPAYHDHNWGVWRKVAWEWGVARGSSLSLLYGGLYGWDRQRGVGSSTVRSPLFLTVLDSLGVKQVLRLDPIRYQGTRASSGNLRATAPARFELLATRDSDTLRLHGDVADALGTEMGTGSFRRVFLQMRGPFRLTGRLLGDQVADSGLGFFETYVH